MKKSDGLVLSPATNISFKGTAFNQKLEILKKERQSLKASTRIDEKTLNLCFHI
jgi:hypothetical protein